MKKILLLLLSIVFITTIKAQKIIGLWYSQDSSRIYEIKELSGNNFMATIKSSYRKKDSVGYVVIKNLLYNIRRKRYEGIIYAVADGQATFVKIKFDKHNSNKLILKLNRMLVMDIAINWVRV